MDDLFAKMQELLNSEEGQQQLKNVASMLGGTDGKMPDLSALSGIMGGASGGSEQGQSQTQAESGGGFDFSNIDMGMLMQVQKILSSMNNEDENTRLLMALKPHFKEERRDKIDQAVKMLRLFSVLPMLKDSGILGGLFGDGRK